MEKINGSMQVIAVIFRFSRSVIIKCSQAAISATVGMEHQQYRLRSVQRNGFTNLLQYELAVRFIVITGQALGPASYPDGI